MIFSFFVLCFIYSGYYRSLLAFHLLGFFYPLLAYPSRLFLDNLDLEIAAQCSLRFLGTHLSQEYPMRDWEWVAREIGRFKYLLEPPTPLQDGRAFNPWREPARGVVYFRNNLRDPCLQCRQGG